MNAQSYSVFADGKLLSKEDLKGKRPEYLSYESMMDKCNSFLPLVVVTEKPFIEVYKISDLHAEAEANLRWLEKNCIPRVKSSDIFNIMIVPGDVGSNLQRVELVFSILSRNYDLVAFVVGNHEAWCSGGDTKENSLHKLDKVLQIASKWSIFTQPIKIVSSSAVNAKSIYVLPLQAWYHCGFDVEPEVESGSDLVSSQESFNSRWCDFAFCKWPITLVNPALCATVKENSEALSEYFGSFNAHWLNGLCSVKDASISISPLDFYARKPEDFVISFSHYLPRQELMPEKRYLFEPNLMKVIGSNVLRTQVELLRPHLHLFGHTHIPIDIMCEDIRYIQWPLGYAREHSQQCKVVCDHGPLLVWSNRKVDQTINSVFSSDVSVGGAVELFSFQSRWSIHYRENRRNAHIMELAEWVVQYKETKKRQENNLSIKT